MTLLTRFWDPPGKGLVRCSLGMRTVQRAPSADECSSLQPPRDPLKASQGTSLPSLPECIRNEDRMLKDPCRQSPEQALFRVAIVSVDTCLLSCDFSSDLSLSPNSPAPSFIHPMQSPSRDEGEKGWRKPMAGGRLLCMEQPPQCVG